MDTTGVTVHLQAVTWKEADGAFVALAPGIPGGRGFGVTPELALGALEEQCRTWFLAAGPTAGQPDLTQVDLEILLAHAARDPDDEILTLTEAASRLGITSAALRAACARGHLPAILRGHTYLVAWSAVQAYRASRHDRRSQGQRRRRDG